MSRSKSLSLEFFLLGITGALTCCHSLKLAYVLVIVEVKTTLCISDIKYFIRNILNRFPTLAPRYADRKVYAGVAYVKTGSNEANVIKYAEDSGLFIIKVVNNTNKIVNSAGFKLRDYRPDCS